MTRKRFLLNVLILTILPVAASGQGGGRPDSIVIFKDGFTIKGKVNEKVRDIIYDSASGRSFPILSGEFFLDDNVRCTIFSPTNVQKVVPLKAGDIPRMKPIKRIDVVSQSHNLPPVESIGPWSDSGERTITLKGPSGSIEVKQKIGVISPQHVLVVTMEGYRWNPYYLTQEFGPEASRAFLLKMFNTGKEFKDANTWDKHMKIAAFLQEAGWFNEAEQELTTIVKAFPDEAKVAEDMLVKLRKDRADLFVESIVQAKKTGQHFDALEQLTRYEEQGYDKIVSPKFRASASDLKTDYDRDKLRVDQARKHLLELGKASPVWKKATGFILDELNYDTVDRLDEFMRSAEQLDLDRKNKRKGQSDEQVLAIAVSSWLQGKQAFEPDPKAAFKLVRAREFLLEYLQADTEAKRTGLFSAFKRDSDLWKDLDVMARLLRLIPPPNAEDPKKLDNEVQTIELTGDNGGSYLVQLPPGYHHQRAYPVLLAFHSGRDKADDTLKRLRAEAAKHGFILVAPHWAGKNILRAKYRYSAADHALVADTLRDIRRRFQVDSDRVFLFGWEDGANMAIDIALGHPDQFAGVVAMNGTLTPFARRFCWQNAQYVPFYVIEGERNLVNSKGMRELFKDNWTHEPFACLYVEYKGRGSEWFAAEVAPMFSWMSRKVRHVPTKEMGRSAYVGGVSEEFRSSRGTDNRFYWLSSDGPVDRCLNDHTVAKVPPYSPALFQATLSLGNKSKKDGTENIWNQISVRTHGLKNVTIWITPEMMPLKHPLQIYLNGQPHGIRKTIQPSLETLLDDVYQTGDRQRLFLAKIELKIAP